MSHTIGISYTFKFSESGLKFWTYTIYNLVPTKYLVPSSTNVYESSSK